MTIKQQTEKIPLDYQWIAQKIYYTPPSRCGNRTKEESLAVFHALLEQAFTRRSFANENGGTHNETLEFIGDAVLEILVTKYLAKIYVKQDVDITSLTRYTISLDGKTDEDTLSQTREKLIKNKYLAGRIDELDLFRFLTMGASDSNAEYAEDELIKIKADLFEAIVGALTLSAEWKLDDIETSIFCMLDIENYPDISDDNYTQLFQQWYQKYTQTVPEYTYKELANGFRCSIDFHITVPNIFDVSYNRSCVGYSKKSARAKLAKDIWEYLEEKGFTDPLLDDYTPYSITCENAINKLQELYQKGYCTEPDYIQLAKENFAEDGKFMWKCVCTIHDLTNGKYRYGKYSSRRNYASQKEKDTIMKSATSTSKVNAKKYAAYAVLQTYFGWDKKNKSGRESIRGLSCR